jgi:LPXTG-site transpeptidase (sortase) family protein
MALSKRVNKKSIKKLPSPPKPPSKKHIINHVLVYNKEGNKQLKRKRFKKTLKIIILTIVLIEGIILAGIGYYEKYYKYRVLSFASSPYETVSVEKKEDTPKKVIIKGLDINVDLEEGFIEQGVWKLSDTRGSYLINSSAPGEGGNVVVYGHNREHIFANLKNIKEEDIIRIVTQSDLVYMYKVAEVKKVKPNVVEDVQPKDYEVLTIFTCIGFMDSERLIVKAIPII